MALSQYPNVEAIDKAITNSPPKPYNPSTGTDDGFWYIYDPLTQAYFKSNVEHRGKPLQIAGERASISVLESEFPNGDGSNSYTVGNSIAVWNTVEWILMGTYDDTAIKLSVSNIVSGVTTVGNADKLDGKQATDFAPSGFGLGGTYKIFENFFKNNIINGFWGVYNAQNAPAAGLLMGLNVGQDADDQISIAFTPDANNFKWWIGIQRAGDTTVKWKQMSSNATFVQANQPTTPNVGDLWVW